MWTPNANGTYTVSYSIVVENNGGAVGTYSLTDTPMFDDDITILLGGYNIDQACCPELAGDFIGNPGSITLANDVSIEAGATDTYTIDFVVELDLEEGSEDGGDNVYNACDGSIDGSEGNPGEGLYNLAELDRNADGTNDVEDDACADLPNVDMEKDFVSATPNADGSYDVTYKITVTNTGGATGVYSLTDTPMFDDDVTINDGSYVGHNSGSLNTTGSTTLATAESIDAGDMQMYTLTFNVTLDLTEGSEGDNEYDACSTPGNGPGSNPGEGLYNVAELDRGSDGTNEVEDDACGDLPNVDMEKDFVSATPNTDGSYDVTYKITVTNTGGATGIYSLTDTPMFDDDVTINDGSYVGHNSGSLNTTGSTTLATAESIDAGDMQMYTLTFNVTLDLTEGSDGDNEYDVCSTPGNGPGSNPGEGLYNVAELDRGSDGTNEVEDDACGDLPNVDMEKDFVSAIQLEDGTYDVTYEINVTNIGGATGTYSLTDTPMFDDDITINSGSYAGHTSGALNTSGSTTLATGESIDAGGIQMYTLTFNVTLDLEEGSNDGGDNTYTPCDESSTGSEGSPGEGLYNLAELDRNSDGTNDTDDDACGDLPASLGDYVWEDVNGNGAQDEGPESALEGIEVLLSGTTDDGETVNASTMTDENGFYEFINLAPGDYKVTFPTTTDIDGEAAQLTREDVTGDANDANDTNDDSDPNVDDGMTETVNLDYAEHDPRLDAGYYVPGTISGYVLADTDNDDEGEDPIEGIFIELVDNFNGQVVGTVQTDENGYYEFTDLAPGNYTLNEVTEPGADWIDVTDFDMSVDANDPDGDDGFAPNDMIPVTLLSGEDDEDNDFIEEQLVSIGDYVWLDTNADGLQDEEDTGIEGVEVKLLDEDGNELDSEMTDEDGFYLFDNLEPGIYEIQFMTPDGRIRNITRKCKWWKCG